MATLSKAVDKARKAEAQARSKVKKLEADVEARVSQVLAKDGPADKLAQRLDRMALEMKRDIDRLSDKWAKQFKALGDAIQTKNKPKK